MPFKDPEKRREYHRNYSREWYRRNKDWVRLKGREWKRLDYKKNPEKHRERLRQWTKSHPEQVQAMRRRYYQKNREKLLVKNREYHRRRREIWRGGIKSSKKISAKAEKLVAEKILPKLGFSNIIHLGDQSPFDILAERNSKKFVVEVTTFYGQLHKNKKAFEILKFFRPNLAVVFITPNLKSYVFKEFEFDEIPRYPRLSFKDIENKEEIHGA